MISTQKIFVAEGRILANGDAICVQLRARQQQHAEMRNLHGPPEGALQVPRKESVHAVGAHKH